MRVHGVIPKLVRPSMGRRRRRQKLTWRETPRRRGTSDDRSERYVQSPSVSQQLEPHEKLQDADGQDHVVVVVLVL